MTKVEQDAVFTVCLMAAFADGGRSDLELAEIKRIASQFANLDPAVYQKVLLQEATLSEVIAPLAEPDKRQNAYEMAVCVCNVDGTTNDAEKLFLKKLQHLLGLSETAISNVEDQAGALAEALPPRIATDSPTPPKISGPDPELDRMIQNGAILNGALELLPETLSTMAIVPLQMKLVYRIGQHYGYQMDRGHIVELLGTAGIGITSQAVEGFARKLFSGIAGKIAGGLGRRIASQAASSGMSFASTYALGHAAKQYYSGGRKLSAFQFKELVESLTDQAKSLHSRFLPEIEQRAYSLNPAKVIDLVRSS